MITAFVIVIFIAAYLFREWAMQNLLVEDEPQEDEEHLEQQHRAAGAALDVAQPLLGQQGLLNDDQPHHLAREHQQVAIDTLLNAIQNLDPPGNNVEADRNELQARLAEMRRVLEQQRVTSNDDNQQRGSGSRPSTPRNDHDNEGAGASWLQDHVSPSTTDDHEQHPSSSSSRHSSNGKQRAASTFVDESDEDDNNSESTEERQRHMNALTRDTVIANWYDKHDSDEDVYRRRWRAPEFSEDDDDDDDDDDDAAHMFGNQRQHSPHLHNHRHRPIDNHMVEEAAAAAAAARDPTPAAMMVEEDALDNNDDGGDDEMEPFDFGDDIDGVLEAVGMRGNPWMLLQNSVLMSLMVSLCLGVAVWIPYVVGRLVISVSTFPYYYYYYSTILLLIERFTDYRRSSQ